MRNLVIGIEVYHTIVTLLPNPLQLYAAPMSQMNFPTATLVLFCFATSLVWSANAIFYKVLGEVNGKRDSQNQISAFFVDSRLFEVLSLHRQYYPESRKTLWVYLTAILGFVAGFIGFLYWI